MVAYVWAETTLTASNFSPIKNWAATGLVSFLAPRAQASQARQMLERSARSFTLNPEWIARQAALSRQSTATVLQQTQETMAAQQQRYQRLDAERHQQSMQMDDIINGVQWTTDSATGQHHEAALGPNPGYFYNPATGVSVNAAMQPGAPFDWHKLTPTAR
jgi:AraC-like DNA-binding protein